MNASSEVQTFRFSRLAAVIGMLGFLFFLLVGLTGLWVFGGEAGAWVIFGVFVTLGLIGAATTIASLRAKVTVRTDGIARTSYLGDFTARWDEIESWRVVHDTFDDRFDVRFRVRGRSSEVVVHESEVYRPGFEAFQDAIRAFAAEREMVVNRDVKEHSDD